MTNRHTTLPDRIPSAPAEYDPGYMDRLVGMLNMQFTTLASRRRVNGTTASLTELPTSATGLRSGELWNDSGTVKVVT
jgi:hypothetical protein